LIDRLECLIGALGERRTYEFCEVSKGLAGLLTGHVGRIVGRFSSMTGEEARSEKSVSSANSPIGEEPDVAGEERRSKKVYQ
jgi:hypothetical protein